MCPMTPLKNLPTSSPYQSTSLFQKDPKTYSKLQLNYRRAKQTDHSPDLDALADRFDYEQCQGEYWQPEEFSLLYGTPLWQQSSSSQRLLLNQLYWLAYYSQIISAEVATIFFNQTSATGLYSLQDFRLVCDTLDLETSQERSHIHAFETVIEQVETRLFGQPCFGRPRRSPFNETMIFADTTPFKNWWKGLQLRTFGLLSAGNVFLACHYLTVRGLRTLNGKLVQHKLSRYTQQYPDLESAPIPAQISYYHFLDESFHFNTSTILSQDVSRLLKPPTPFEQYALNLGIQGCQRDHYPVSVAVNGIFWYDGALYPVIYAILRSPHFGLTPPEAMEMLRQCFTEESEGLHRSFQTHQEAIDSYQAYIAPLDYLSLANRSMTLMASNSPAKYLKRQAQALQSFRQHHPELSGLLT